jgi:hypothetical protein
MCPSDRLAAARGGWFELFQTQWEPNGAGTLVDIPMPQLFIDGTWMVSVALQVQVSACQEHSLLQKQGSRLQDLASAFLLSVDTVIALGIEQSTES